MENNGMIEIKVLGPGCANCANLETVARNAVTHLGVTADIGKITDYGEMMRYDIMSTPGLVINEKLVSAGRIPSVAEVVKWLQAA
jgi:small redox-active disulfide protein 2